MWGKSRAAQSAIGDEVGVRAQEQSPGGKHFRQSTNLAAVWNSDQRNRRKETGRKRRLLDSTGTAAQPRRERATAQREVSHGEADTGFPDTLRKPQGRVVKAQVKQEHSFKFERLECNWDEKTACFAGKIPHSPSALRLWDGRWAKWDACWAAGHIELSEIQENPEELRRPEGQVYAITQLHSCTHETWQFCGYAYIVLCLPSLSDHCLECHPLCMPTGNVF